MFPYGVWMDSSGREQGCYRWGGISIYCFYIEIWRAKIWPQKRISADMTPQKPQKPPQRPIAETKTEPTFNIRHRALWHAVECLWCPRLVLWTWAWIWIWYCFLSLKGSQGVALGSLRVNFFHDSFWPIFQPSKIHLWCPLGVKLVPKWPQKWACLGARKHQKNDLV